MKCKLFVLVSREIQAHPNFQLLPLDLLLPSLLFVLAIPLQEVRIMKVTFGICEILIKCLILIVFMLTMFLIK